MINGTVSRLQYLRDGEHMLYNGAWYEAYRGRLRDNPTGAPTVTVMLRNTEPHLADQSTHIQFDMRTDQEVTIRHHSCKHTECTQPAPDVQYVNLTPHPVTILDADGTVTVEYPPSGTVARMQSMVIDRDERGPRRLNLGRSTPIPHPRPGVGYIVPLYYAAMHDTRWDLVVPHDLVRNESGRVVGCRELIPLGR